MSFQPVWLLLIVGLVLSVPADAAGEIRTDNARDSDPELKFPPTQRVFEPSYKPLWIKALRRPEADIQRMAAETIAQAHAFGFPDMEDARPELQKILSAEDSHPAARFAAARTLIALNTRDAAEGLFDAAQKHGSPLRQLIEPTLAEWDFRPVRETWMKRITDPKENRRELVLAVRGLGQVREDRAVTNLLSIVQDSKRPADVRLESAHAAGAIRKEGLEAEVTKLTERAKPSILNRLCAAALLNRHSSAAAQKQLSELSQDAEPSVAAAALARLLAIDPVLVLPLAEGAMRNADANVRQRGAEAYLVLPTPERVEFLAGLLDDPHPVVRGKIREAFFEFARNPDLESAVRTSTVRILGQDGWRGQEQAILLLAALDHKAAAGRFIQLLEAERGEVLVTAAWGLRKLAIPETLPAIVDKLRRQTEIREKKDGTARMELDPQVSHLCEAVGVMKYVPADALLRKYVPKDFTYGDLSRPAAIWALGHLHAGTPDEDLAKLLIARLTDTNPFPSETFPVKQMSAVSLARMKAVSQVPAMRQWLGAAGATGKGDPALMWALTQLTGEKFPDPPPMIVGKSGWFLEPLLKPSPEQP